jgi:hypothetical protein
MMVVVEVLETFLLYLEGGRMLVTHSKQVIIGYNLENVLWSEGE